MSREEAPQWQDGGPQIWPAVKGTWNLFYAQQEAVGGAQNLLYAKQEAIGTLEIGKGMTIPEPKQHCPCSQYMDPCRIGEKSQPKNLINQTPLIQLVSQQSLPFPQDIYGSHVCSMTLYKLREDMTTMR